MLAVMASLASAVHGETALTPSLLAFYATIGTVIPVLFIVLVVQGTTYQQIIRVSRDLRDRRARTSSRGSRFAAPVVTGGGSLVLFYAAFFILFAGGVGEFGAIFALYQGSDTRSSRLAVLVLAGFLILMVVGGPILELTKPVTSGPESRPGGPDNGKAAPPVGPAAPSGRAGRDPDEVDARST